MVRASSTASLTSDATSRGTPCGIDLIEYSTQESIHCCRWHSASSCSSSRIRFAALSSLCNRASSRADLLRCSSASIEAARSCSSSTSSSLSRLSSRLSLRSCSSRLRVCRDSRLFSSATEAMPFVTGAPWRKESRCFRQTRTWPPGVRKLGSRPSEHSLRTVRGEIPSSLAASPAERESTGTASSGALAALAAVFALIVRPVCPVWPVPRTGWPVLRPWPLLVLFPFDLFCISWPALC